MLAGVALVGPGLSVQAAFLGLTGPGALREAVFDLSLGLFVVAPVAFLELLSTERDPPALGRRPAMAIGLVLAAIGAAGAFLQSLYAAAVLSSGSLDAGLAEVTRGTQYVLVLRDLWGLFVGISLVVTVAAWGPRGRHVAAATVAAQVVLLSSGRGLPGPALGVSASMLVVLAIVVPLTDLVGERAAARVRAWRERARRRGTDAAACSSSSRSWRS